MSTLVLSKGQENEQQKGDIITKSKTFYEEIIKEEVKISKDDDSILHLSFFQDASFLQKQIRQQLKIDENTSFVLSYEGKELQTDQPLFQQIADQGNLDRHYSIKVHLNGIQSPETMNGRAYENLEKDQELNGRTTGLNFEVKIKHSIQTGSFVNKKKPMHSTRQTSGITKNPQTSGIKQQSRICVTKSRINKNQEQKIGMKETTDQSQKEGIDIFLVNQDNLEQRQQVKVQLNSDIGSLDKQFSGQPMTYRHKLEILQKNKSFSHHQIQNGEQILYQVIPNRMLVVYFQDAISNQQQELQVQSNQSIILTFQRFLQQNQKFCGQNFSLQYCGEEVQNIYTTFEELQVREYSQFFYNLSNSNEKERNNSNFENKEITSIPEENVMKNYSNKELEVALKNPILAPGCEQNAFQNFRADQVAILLNSIAQNKDLSSNSGLLTHKMASSQEIKNMFLQYINQPIQTVGDFKQIIHQIIQPKSGLEIDIIIDGRIIPEHESFQVVKVQDYMSFKVKMALKVRIRFVNRLTKEIKESKIDYYQEILLGADELEIANSQFYYNNEEINVNYSCYELSIENDAIIEYEPNEY